MADRALLVGINKYPGQPLNGCINDVDDMAAYLVKERGFGPGAIPYLKDGQATTANIVAGLNALVAGLQAGEPIGGDGPLGRVDQGVLEAQPAFRGAHLVTFS